MPSVTTSRGPRLNDRYTIPYYIDEPDYPPVMMVEGEIGDDGVIIDYPRERQLVVALSSAFGTTLRSKVRKGVAA